MNDRIPVTGSLLSLQLWGYRLSAHCRFCSVMWWWICSTSKQDLSLWAQLMNEMVIVNILVITDWKVKFTLEDILCWWKSLYHVCLDYTVSLWAFFNLLSNYKTHVQCLWDSACKFYRLNKSWWEKLSWWSLFLHNFFLFLIFRNLQEVWGKFENTTSSSRLFFLF